MALDFIRPPADSPTGTKNVGMSRTATTRYRAEGVIADPDVDAAICQILNAAPASNAYALPVRQVGAVPSKPLEGVPGTTSYDGYSATPGLSNVLTPTTTAMDAIVIAHIGAEAVGQTTVTVQDGSGQILINAVPFWPHTTPFVLAGLGGLLMVNGVTVVVSQVGTVAVWVKGRQ